MAKLYHDTVGCIVTLDTTDRTNKLGHSRWTITLQNSRGTLH